MIIASSRDLSGLFTSSICASSAGDRGSPYTKIANSVLAGTITVWQFTYYTFLKPAIEQHRECGWVLPEYCLRMPEMLAVMARPMYY